MICLNFDKYLYLKFENKIVKIPVRYRDFRFSRAERIDVRLAKVLMDAEEKGKTRFPHVSL